MQAQSSIILILFRAQGWRVQCVQQQSVYLFGLLCCVVMYHGHGFSQIGTPYLKNMAYEPTFSELWSCASVYYLCLTVT